MRALTRIPAGLLDAGLASMAMFAVGIGAQSMLSERGLGIYAIFFTAFVLAAVIPTQLVLVPAEVASLSLERQRRLDLTVEGLRNAWGIAVGAGVAVGLVLGVVPADLRSVGIPLAVTASLTSVVSPLQDHMRRMMHLADASWAAAAVSAVQLGSTLVLLFVGSLANLSAAWVPFGALAGANIVSSVAAWLLVKARAATPTLRLQLKALLDSGRWLIVVGLAPAAAAFVAAMLIKAFAGEEALGHAEAARVVGQPVLVFSLGLATVIGPRSMESARRRDLPTARSYRILFTGLTAVGGVLCYLAIGAPWPWNPLASMTAKAFVVPGLVVATLAANVLNSIVNPLRSELVGAGLEQGLAGVEVVGGAGRVVAAAATAGLGAFALPASFGVLGAARMVGYRRRLLPHYGSDEDVEAMGGRGVDHG